MTRSSPRPRRARPPADLAVEDDLAAPRAWERVVGWPIPSDAALCDVDGQRAVRIIGEPRGMLTSDDARGALGSLRKLATAPESHVLRFVQRFGSLFQPEDEMGVGWGGMPYQPDGRGDLVEDYRTVARLVEATLRITSLVSRSRPVPVIDLSTALEFLESIVAADYSAKTAAAICERLVLRARGTSVPFETSLRRVPVGVVNGWLRAKGVSPHLRWPDSADRPAIQLSGGLMGFIASELMHYVRAGERTLTCDGCGREFTRSRRPKTGQQVWCSSVRCRRRRDREAQRRSRTRTTTG